MKPKQQPKTRSFIAQSAHFRQAGAMGGSAKQNNKRDRQATKQSLRKEGRYER